MKNSFKWKNKISKIVKSSSLSKIKNVRKKFETLRSSVLLVNLELSNPTSLTQALMASTKLGEACRETETSTQTLTEESRLRATRHKDSIPVRRSIL